MLAKQGKSLVLVARRHDELEKLRSEIKAIAPKIDVIIKAKDLSYSENVYGLYESLANLDIETWINNAGFGDSNFVKDVEIGKIENMIRLNVEALTVLSSLYVRDYHNVEGATLLNVASVVGYHIAKKGVTYSATKFFVSAYTEGLARELMNDGDKLRAKVLSPVVRRRCPPKTGKSLQNREEAMRRTIVSSLSNGKMEGTNNKIKLIKRRGYGYRNLERFFLRLRFELGR